ncbi:MAG: hypothetical protein ACT4P7_02245 [Gemmatimonadaceae bacterium]
MSVLSRLKGRSLAELQDRASQRMHALVEQVRGPQTEISAAGALSRLVSESERARFETPDAWSQDLLGGRFFPGCDDLAA